MDFTNETKTCKTALAAGIYYTSLGLWPLLALQSFTGLTGLTHHLEIVHFLATVWTGLGFALLLFYRSTRVVPYLAVISTCVGSMLALGQLCLVSAGSISPLFLIQSMAEMLIVFTWMRTLLPRETMLRLKPRDLSSALR